MIALVVSALLAGAAPATTDPFEPLQPYLVGISVRDAAVSAAWYADKLGFRETRRMDLPEHGVKIVFLQRGEFRLELIEKAGSKPLKDVAPKLEDDVLVHGLRKIAFLVQDADAAAARLRAAGVRFVVEPFDDKPMKLRSFIVADPDGNLVQFMQATP